MPPRLHLDYETRCDLDLKKVGVRRYVSHPSFQVLMSAWAWGDGEVEQVEGFWFPEKPCNVHAFNAPFELAVARQVLGPWGLDHAQWRCTMVHAYGRGFSGGLADVGAQIGLPQDRQKKITGSRLITKFCKPRKPSKANPERYWTPETAPKDWDEFKSYNRQDVVAEREIWRILDSLAPWSKAEQELWLLDRTINDRGIAVDLKLVRNAIKVAEWYARDLERRCVELCGVRPSEVTQLLAWAQDGGYPMGSLEADVIRKWLDEEAGSPLVREVLQVRLDFAQSAVKKFQAIANRAHDGRMHDPLQMFGAQRTGRWAGRGLQLQNLKRPTMKDPEAAAELLLEDPEMFYRRYSFDDLGSLVRSAIVAA